jgi:exopolysaccharide biosynthesis polyprenyl glycosylphosphotransferase
MRSAMAAVNAAQILAHAEQQPALEASRGQRKRLRRRQLVRGGLVFADLVGLSLAFAVSAAVFGLSANGEHARPVYELLVFFLSLPAWVLLASLCGLYRYDEGRLGHSTVDDSFGVVQLVTLGAWVFFVGCWVTGISTPRPEKLIGFWVLATLSITACRALARSLCLRSPAYVQRTVILGGGDLGQLVARKLLRHREYGIHLLGIVDDAPKERRAELGDLPLLGAPDELPRIVDELRVERVIIAFSNDRDAHTAEIARGLHRADVQVDVVPRLYELVGPRVDVHTVEGLPLVGLPSPHWSPSAMRVKRAIDIVGSSLGLLALSPLFAYIAWKVRRSSPGPIFFRQTRLGLNMQEFTALKFRTMWTDTDDSEHRAYIERTMSSNAESGSNGLYKLEREHAVTPFGRWLRRTSLDELPQLINVLRGEMSLVGPRPCIPYEVTNFKPQHFERFLLPAGLTGLWQVTARAYASFGEALDMDVAYVRGWSLGLDLRLLCRTPLELLRPETTA